MAVPWLLVVGAERDTVRPSGTPQMSNRTKPLPVYERITTGVAMSLRKVMSVSYESVLNTVASRPIG